MTINEAIALVDQLRPNSYTNENKISWLSKLDGRIFTELYKTHEDCPSDSFAGYDSDTDGSTELLVPYPYAEDIYNYFLQAQIDKENGETMRYNGSITMYNSAFAAYAAVYNRDHAPIPVGTRFRF